MSSLLGLYTARWASRIGTMYEDSYEFFSDGRYASYGSSTLQGSHKFDGYYEVEGSGKVVLFDKAWKPERTAVLRSPREIVIDGRSYTKGG